MKCPNCQFENPNTANFCSDCGQGMNSGPMASLASMSFDDKIEKIQKYLPEGLKDKILNQKDKIEGERKQVTIMFCDMEGFTALVERIGPEEAYYVMDEVYEILIHTVHDFEGMVNEMTGDGIMAIFGAPIALEDAPQKSILSALAIHREITRFCMEKDNLDSMQMRIGIHTGYVVVGTLGNNLRVDFKAVGDTVNLASRMEKIAEAGSTFVTEDTFKLTKGLFRFEAIGKKKVKGKKKRVFIYKVLSANEDLHRPRLGSGRLIYSEMVGRNQELNRLELQAMKAVNGKGSIVNIIGEAGIGKSRLVAELKKREVMKRATLLEGRAISIGRNLSFHPIIDLLKQWARIRADDGEAMAFGKLEAAVRNLYPQDIGEVLPFVATLMGMKPSGRYAEKIAGIEGEALEKLILKNLRGLLIKATELAPLVIVLEDLHWADASTLEMAESLFRLAETRRILFINVFRPGYEQTGNRIAYAIKERLPVYYIELALEPLDVHSSETLINSILKSNRLHHAVIKQIIERTSGNPFFIEEVLRSFIDQGVFLQKDGKFEVTDKIHAITIPYTIHDVLMGRIDRLEEQTRSLVMIASVIGRSFFHRILAEVATDIEDLDGKLEHLKKKQLFWERKRMGEIEYIFKHALAQEVAYESILPFKCKELHLKVAQSIENVFGDRIFEFYGMLAYHYSKAEDLVKAEEYLLQAGEEALKSSASNEALYFYQEVLSLHLKENGEETDPEKLAKMEKNIALALYNRGLYAESIEHFDKALDHYWGKMPTNAISSMHKFNSAILELLISVYLSSLKFRKRPTQRDIEVLDLFHKKCKALGTINPKRFFFEFLFMYKRVTSFDLRNFDLGIEIYMDASALFSFSGNLFQLSRRILDSAKPKINNDNVRILINFDFLETILNYFQGNWRNINDYDEALVNKNLSIGEIYWASQHLFWHGVPYIYQGFLDRARSIVNRLNEIIEVYENDFSILLKLELNIILLIECRDFKHALDEIKKAIDITKKANFRMYLLDIYSYKIRIYSLMGEMKKAENYLSKANQLKNELSTVPTILSTLYRSELELYINRFKQAIKRFKQAIKAGENTAIAEYGKKVKNTSKLLLNISQKAAQHRTEAYKLTGVYYWLINKQKKALKYWRRSIEAGVQLGAHLELSRAYFEIGKRLLEPGSKYAELNGIKAEEYLTKAKALFDEMDLQWDCNEMANLFRGSNAGSYAADASTA